jgi:hypothetical protein
MLGKSLLVIGGIGGLLAANSAFGGAPLPGRVLIGFNDLQPGTVVNNQYSSASGVVISVQRSSSGPAVATLYDTSRTGEPDPDLQIPFAMGNLGTAGPGGNVLIIPENNTDRNGDGLIDSPNDEGSRPAGQFTFDFLAPVESFGFDLVDVEGPAEFNNNAGYFASFYLDGELEARVGYASFTNPLSPFYDPTVVFGDNSANRIRPITARQVGMPQFDRVVLNFGGSGGTDNLVFTFVPEPSALALGVIPALSLLRRRRR